MSSSLRAPPSSLAEHRRGGALSKGEKVEVLQGCHQGAVGTVTKVQEGKYTVHLTREEETVDGLTVDALRKVSEEEAAAAFAKELGAAQAAAEVQAAEVLSARGKKEKGLTIQVKVRPHAASELSAATRAHESADQTAQALLRCTAAPSAWPSCRWNA